MHSVLMDVYWILLDFSRTWAQYLGLNIERSICFHILDTFETREIRENCSFQIIISRIERERERKEIDTMRYAFAFWFARDAFGAAVQ